MPLSPQLTLSLSLSSQLLIKPIATLKSPLSILRARRKHKTVIWTPWKRQKTPLQISNLLESFRKWRRKRNRRTSNNWRPGSMSGTLQSRWKHWRGFTPSVLSRALLGGSSLYESALYYPISNQNRSKFGSRTGGEIEESFFKFFLPSFFLAYFVRIA